MFLIGWLRQLLLQCLNDDPQCSGKVVKPFMGLAWSQPSKDHKILGQRGSYRHRHLLSKHSRPYGHHSVLGCTENLCHQGEWKEKWSHRVAQVLLITFCWRSLRSLRYHLGRCSLANWSFEGFLTLHPAITSEVVS